MTRFPYFRHFDTPRRPQFSFTDLHASALAQWDQTNDTFQPCDNERLPELHASGTFRAAASVNENQYRATAQITNQAYFDVWLRPGQAARLQLQGRSADARAEGGDRVDKLATVSFWAVFLRPGSLESLKGSVLHLNEQGRRTLPTPATLTYDELPANTTESDGRRKVRVYLAHVINAQILGASQYEPAQWGSALAEVNWELSLRFVTPAELPPGPPVLSYSRFGPEGVRLAWSPGPGGVPLRYYLSAGITPGGTEAVAGADMGQLTSFEYDGLPQGVTYFVRVTAVNASGRAESNEVEILIVNPNVPGAPRIQVVQGTANPITLAWNAGSGGTPAQYVLSAGTSPGASNLGSFNLGAATSITAAAPVDLRVYVRVTAQNGAGTATSDEVSFYVIGRGGLGAPVLQPPMVSGTTVQLAWNGVC